MVHTASKTPDFNAISLLLHQRGACREAGARAPGFFVRVRFVGARPRASTLSGPCPGPVRVILRVV